MFNLTIPPILTQTNKHSSPNIIEHKKTMTYDARNPGHSLAQAQKCGGA